ncbi:pyridoxal phosphate-dependent decarboxylase family protein [Actinacidiphila rubida]|uniref:pyridoxal phosphate-dependent decarboxylase family protein n=1 Tax=Actinacidiphila rubida TaxID=310780 RepID=UPI000849DBC2
MDGFSADELRPLVETVYAALTEGARDRAGAAPRGGPESVAERVAKAVGDVLPRGGTGDREALYALVHVLAEGAADPAEPHCAAHLHCPPLAVAAAADLAASALNPSMDSWDQAPAASELEARATAALAAVVYPDLPAPDALVTTGGTESNQLALLLARERAAGGPRVQTICGANAHHSVQRAAWLLGLPNPVVLATPAGVLDPVVLDRTLDELPVRRALVVATAGTTETGAIDPLADIAKVTARHEVELHVDAAYGGPLLFSRRQAAKLDGLQSAVSVTLDLHKMGWQPVAAGLLAVPDGGALRPLDHRADYLNAQDDTEAGMPDLLGRSLRTTRRPDILKIAVTLRSLGRDGMAALVDTVCELAQTLAAKADAHPGLTLYGPPAISTVLFRPADASDEDVAELRRRLLYEGRAVLGRARADGRLWLKATLLNPRLRPEDLDGLLALAAGPPHPTGSTEGTTAP